MNPNLIANLHLESGGPKTGPAILLLHGVTRQIADLAPIIDRLPKHLGWIAVDFPGHGKSPASGGDYKVHDYTLYVGQLLESLNRKPIIIFGHSLGAMVAAQAAALFPNHITGAILEDPPFSTMGAKIKESTFYLQFQGVRDLLWSMPDNLTLFRKLRDLSVRRASDGAQVKFCEIRDDASLQTYANYLSQVDPRVLDPIVSAEWLDGYDLEQVATKIRCPTLLFQADPKFGGMLTDDEANAFATNASNCRLTKFEGAAHLLHASHADALANEINRHLQSLVPSLM
jgi:pimeloyl-ACP methyl ester carboxylesterase